MFDRLTTVYIWYVTFIKVNLVRSKHGMQDDLYYTATTETLFTDGRLVVFQCSGFPAGFRKLGITLERCSMVGLDLRRGGGQMSGGGVIVPLDLKS